MPKRYCSQRISGQDIKSI